MSDERADAGAEGARREDVLQQIDPSVNIFALANGLDLIKDPDGVPARILEWYRDGMERRIHVAPAATSPDGALDLEVSAIARHEGRKLELRRGFRAAVAPGELKATLPEAIEGANGITRVDVERDGTAR